MDINVSIDFGNDYRVSLTPHDAKALYEKLEVMFGGARTSLAVPTLTGSGNIPWVPCTSIAGNPSSFTYTTSTAPNADDIRADIGDCKDLECMCMKGNG